MSTTPSHTRGGLDLAIRICVAVLVVGLLVAFLLLSSGRTPWTGPSEPDRAAAEAYTAPGRPQSAGIGEEYPPYEQFTTKGYVRGLNTEIPWTVEIRASILIDSGVAMCDEARRGAPVAEIRALVEEMGFTGSEATTFIEVAGYWLCRSVAPYG